MSTHGAALPPPTEVGGFRAGDAVKNPYELTRGEQIVDVRPWGTRMAEALADPFNFAMAAAGLIFMALVLPMFMPGWIILGLVIVLSSGAVGRVLPFRYPPSAKDPSNKGKPGNGILFLGNLEYDPKKENRLPLENPVDKFKEVWLSDDDLRKHFLILGSTGSGKSELLKAIFFNALCWGSGFFVADGKADNKLPLDNYALARWFGRDDDLLTLNFLLAGKTPEQVRKSRRRRTNKTNPFSTADADTIIQMGANLLPKVDGDAKNWQEKALNCWRGLVPALCWLRDHEGWEISVRHFVDYLALPKLEWLYCKGYDVAHKNGGVWHEGFEGLRAYLEVGLPGFKVELALKKYHGKDGFTYPLPENAAPAMGPGGRPQQGGDQSGQVYEQHGYRATQLNPALNLLDKTYGHIFADKFSEVDMVDVTLNNRILAMLIPSLEKSAQEAESLGKLNVAVLKVMMGKNLGAEIEGSRREILEAKATEANYPYIVALDELGYYFADGIAVMFAQARSLGFAMFAAAQDIEKLTEGSRSAEAGAMLANQVTKVFMRIDDANKTNEMIQKYLDKVTVALRKSYEWDEITGFRRVPEVAIEEIPPVTLKNLQSLKPGRGVINSMGLTLKIKSLYVGDFLQKYKREWFHINRFLQVRSLTPREVEENSLPINVLGDPYIKGYKLLEMLRGSRPLPDFDEVAAGKSYEEDWRLAQAMLREVAAVSGRLPDGARAAQRAIYLFEAARLFLMKQGRLQPDAAYADLLQGAAGRSGGGPQPRDNGLPPENLGGSSIEQGSGSGDLAAPLGAEDDPFDFLNDSCPLKRKPAQEVMNDGAQAPSRLLEAQAQALEPVARALREGDEAADEPLHSSAQDARGGNALDALLEPRKKVLPALDDGDDEASVSATEALRQASLVLPQALQRGLAQAFDEAVVFEMPTQKAQAQRSASAPLDPPRAASAQDQESEADLGEQRRQAQQAKAAATDAHDWVAQALSGANAALRLSSAKGQTVVGLTEPTRQALERLEAALGNPEPQPAAASIERMVAEQATPQPPAADAADLSDIQKLLEAIERAGG